MCHRQPCPLFSVQVDHNGTISEHYWEQCQHLKSSSLHTAYILTAGWVDRVLDRGKGKHFDSLGNSLDSAPKPRVWVLSSASWSQELRLCDPCEPLLTQDTLWFYFMILFELQESVSFLTISSDRILPLLDHCQSFLTWRDQSGNDSNIGYSDEGKSTLTFTTVGSSSRQFFFWLAKQLCNQRVPFLQLSGCDWKCQLAVL